MKSTDLAWVAGFLDGEGCFTVGVSRGRRKFDPKITLTQKDYRPVEKLLSVIGGRAYIDASRLDGRVFHVWAMSGATQLSEILPKIIPFLVLKREQAELLYEMCYGMYLRGSNRVTDNEIERREKITSRLKEMKK